MRATLVVTTFVALLGAACTEPVERRLTIHDLAVLSSLDGSEPLRVWIAFSHGPCEEIRRIEGGVSGQLVEVAVVGRSTTPSGSGGCPDVAYSGDTTLVFGTPLSGPVVIRALQPRGVEPLELSIEITPP